MNVAILLFLVQIIGEESRFRANLQKLDRLRRMMIGGQQSLSKPILEDGNPGTSPVVNRLSCRHLCLGVTLRARS